MKKIVLLLLLAGCSTPVTVMQKGNEIISCGGGTAGSYGGFLGYMVQEGNDHDCVVAHAQLGYKVMTPTQ